MDGLSERQRELISRRFGLGREEKETLEAIGEDFGITRERVRQIQEDALQKIKQKIPNYQNIFQNFEKYFKSFGDLRKEDIALTELGEGKWENEVFFLLTTDGKFKRFGEKEDFYPIWVINENSLSRATEIINSLSKRLRENQKPLALKDLNTFNLKKPVLASYLEISKIIQKNEEGLYGLIEWPEINPRGVRDKAYIVFKKMGKPLHFTEVAKLIMGSHLQTVHNELIRDHRFVLVGRGIYALEEWGYEPGEVKEVITKILTEKGPLNKEEIFKNVFKQRMVKESTILLNLSNRKYFLRDSKGKYNLKSQII